MTLSKRDYDTIQIYDMLVYLPQKQTLLFLFE